VWLRARQIEFKVDDIPEKIRYQFDEPPRMYRMFSAYKADPSLVLETEAVFGFFNENMEIIIIHQGPLDIADPA